MRHWAARGDEDFYDSVMTSLFTPFLDTFPRIMDPYNYLIGKTTWLAH